MLEDRTSAAHLGRSAELALPHPEIGALLPGEAHRSRRTVVAGDGRLHPDSCQPRDERARQHRVDGIDAPGGTRGAGHHDGVRQVGAVQEPASAGRPAHHVDAPAVARVAVDVVVGLEVPEGDRRRRPAVEAQCGRCAGGDGVEQRLVGRHLRGSIEPRVEVVDQAPARHARAGQPSSTSAR